jgi:hypothetical protein
MRSRPQLIVRLDLAGQRAHANAASLGQPVLAVHISPSDDEAARFRGYWSAWGDPPLHNRTARRLRRLLRRRPGVLITTVVHHLAS